MPDTQRRRPTRWSASSSRRASRRSSGSTCISSSSRRPTLAIRPDSSRRTIRIARGKAELGGKTVLDSLDAVAKGLEGVSSAAAAAEAAPRAARAALDALRQRPATVGRARIFAGKSRGLDDPGMLAMTMIVEALADRS